MSKYDALIRRDAFTKNEDGTIFLKGGGWFWIRFNAQGAIIDKAPGMDAKPAARLFIRQAKESLKAYGLIERTV